MRKILVLCVIFGAAGVARAQQPPAGAGGPVEFVLKVSPTTGTVNDEFTVTVSQTIRGVNAPERYWPPEINDFTIVDQRSQQSTQWVIDPRR